MRTVDASLVATLILNGLFLIFLNVLFWKKTAGLRVFWACHLSACFFFSVQFYGVFLIYNTVLMPLAYATGARPYPYPWMNTPAFSDGLCLLLFISVEYLFLGRIAGRLLKWAKGKTPGGWAPWAPFESPVVREIHAHLTAAEKSKMVWWEASYGLWAGATWACPLAYIIADHGNRALVVISASLITIFMACVPVWLKSRRQMLCATAWAKEQGLAPERIKLFAFRS